MMMTFTEVKGHQRSNVVSYATFLNGVILYYLLMRRDVWFANHLVQFWVHVFGSYIEYKLLTKEIRYLSTLLMLLIENLCILHLFVKNNNSTYAVEIEQRLTHVTTTRNSTIRNQSIH